MNRKLSRAAAFAAALSASICAVAACSDDDVLPFATPDAGGADATPPPNQDSGTDAPQAVDSGPVPVTIRFKAKVGTEDFKCGTTYSNQGSTNDTVEPRDLRFFVQDVKLVDGAGKETAVALDERAPWQTKDVALLDFEDGTGKCANGNPELNREITGTAPPGTYTGIVFSNGVPAEINHRDPATEPAPLSAGGMTWGWLLGHLFIKAEMSSTSADGGVGLLHLGSIRCTNSSDGGDDDYQKGPSGPCSQPNRNRVKLASFDAKTNTIVLDVKTLFAGTDLSASSLCHSMGAACPPLFTNVGLDYDGGAQLPTAPAFRVE